MLPKMRLAFALCCALAVAFPGLAQARVVGPEEAGFAECNRFFLAQTPPEGLPGPPSHVKICQKYRQEPRFATLYSTQDKIPLYSAFQYTEAAAAAAPSGEEDWLVEPQVRTRRGPRERVWQRSPGKDGALGLGGAQELFGAC